MCGQRPSDSSNPVAELSGRGRRILCKKKFAFVEYRQIITITTTTTIFVGNNAVRVDVSERAVVGGGGGGADIAAFVVPLLLVRVPIHVVMIA